VFTGLEDLNGFSDSDGVDVAIDDDDTSNNYEDEENVSTCHSNILCGCIQSLLRTH
jgi:hypothetical protein